MNNSVTAIVKGNVAKFQYYQDGNLWYLVENPKNEVDFSFPIPIADCGSARFLKEDNAMLFMRWIRKHYNTLAEKDNEMENSLFASVVGTDNPTGGPS